MVTDSLKPREDRYFQVYRRMTQRHVLGSVQGQEIYKKKTVMKTPIERDYIVRPI